MTVTLSRFNQWKTTWRSASKEYKISVSRLSFITANDMIPSTFLKDEKLGKPYFDFQDFTQSLTCLSVEAVQAEYSRCLEGVFMSGYHCWRFLTRVRPSFGARTHLPVIRGSEGSIWSTRFVCAWNTLPSKTCSSDRYSMEALLCPVIGPMKGWA